MFGDFWFPASCIIQDGIYFLGVFLHGCAVSLTIFLLFFLVYSLSSLSDWCMPYIPYSTYLLTVIAELIGIFQNFVGQNKLSATSFAILSSKLIMLALFLNY